MKSTTSRSLLPEASWARIWLRRSTASGAFESARVWFWHTRQRSSCARPATRLSSAGSWAQAVTAHRRMSVLKAIQLLDQRNELGLHHVRGERPAVLVADHALAVDDVGLGHAVDPVVD